MIGEKKLLAIIPARGGSKRLPKKNIIDLFGKPLISWTIDAALNSRYIDRVVVSTDSDEIAKISKSCSADVPFMRPVELAADDSTSVDVVLHAIDELKGDKYDYIVLLQPTSPLRTEEDIDASVELLVSSNSDAVISVCKSDHSPLWCNVLPDNGDMSNFLERSLLNKRSQDLGEYYCLNGAIYLCDVKKLKDNRAFFFEERCIAYKMERERSVDIDSQIDLDYAKLYLDQINEKI